MTDEQLPDKSINCQINRREMKLAYIQTRFRELLRVSGPESSPTSKRQRNDPSEMWNIDGATMLADAAPPVDKDAKEAAAEVNINLPYMFYF